MYKKQMTAQRVICLLSVIASAVVFVYALGLMTELYDSLYPAMTLETMAQKMVHKGWPKGEPYPETGFSIYYDMQPFNRELLMVSIGLILISLLLFVSFTASRRKYYVGNYISVTLNVVASVVAAIWIHVQTAAFKVQYLAMDFQVLEWALNRLKKPFAVSTLWFDIHYVVCGLLLAVALLHVINALWKAHLMKAEKRLIEEGKKVSA